jgi:DNA-binding response OmpR family regulator
LGTLCAESTDCFLTAHDEAKDLLRVLEAGANDHILKPVVRGEPLSSIDAFASAVPSAVSGDNPGDDGAAMLDSRPPPIASIASHVRLPCESGQ